MGTETVIFIWACGCPHSSRYFSQEQASLRAAGGGEANLFTSSVVITNAPHYRADITAEIRHTFPSQALWK